MRIKSAAALLLLTLAAGAALAQDLPTPEPQDLPVTELATPAPKVNLLYCVPTDKKVNQGYVNAMNLAGTSLVGWYASQVPGHRTFGLANPAVQVILLPHDTTYYANNPRPAIFTQFWDNVLNDVLPLAHASFNDPLNVYAFYVDVDPICNECGGCGTSGVLVVSANDLRGLAGEKSVYDPCSGKTSVPPPVGRWIGGLGHELGHAFGLPHPPGCDDGSQVVCDANAIMWVGYASYPNTYLTAAEKASLVNSPFFLYTLFPKRRAGRR